jgi:hypothetical protein
MVPPRLLSMALEVYLCQAGTLNLVHAPDWTKNWVNHQLYKTHRLYSKTLTYNALHMQAGPSSAPQPRAAPTTAPAPAPVNVPAPAPEPAPVNVPAPAPVTAPAPVFPGYAERPTSIHTPPRPGPSRKRALSGSSSTKDTGRTSPKKRKFKTSSKAKVSTFIVSPNSKPGTRTKRVTRSKSKQPAQPAQSKPTAKSKQAAKSKAILTDTDDEEEKKAPKYVELSEDDADADADGDGDAPMVPAARLPGIIVQKKKASDICLLVNFSSDIVARGR